MRRSDLVAGGLIVSGLLLAGRAAIGDDIAPAQIAVAPLPTVPPSLPPLRVPRVAFAPVNGTGTGATTVDDPSGPRLAAQNSGGSPNLVGTTYFPDAPEQSWALVVDASGIRTVHVGSLYAGSVVKSIGDRVLLLADGRRVEINKPAQPIVPSIGTNTVPVDIATPTPITSENQRPPVSQIPTASPAPAAPVPGINSINPFAPPTPTTALPPGMNQPGGPSVLTPGTYPTPATYAPTAQSPQPSYLQPR